MCHLRRFSESCLLDKFTGATSHHRELISGPATIPDYHPQWTPRYSGGHRPISTRSSLEFPSRARKSSMKTPVLGSFLGPTLEQEEEEHEACVATDDGGMSGSLETASRRSLRLKGFRRRTSDHHQLRSSHRRSSTGLKILIKRLSRTFSLRPAHSESELSIPVQPAHHPGPSRRDSEALVFGDENQEKIEQRAADFYKTFFPSLTVE